MSENMNISFEDGWQEITVHSDPGRVIRWNAMDLDFVDRFFRFDRYVKTELRERIKAISDQIGDRSDNALDNYEEGAIQALGIEFNEKFDETFNTPVSQAAFQGVNPLSPTRNGRLLFDNFLDALGPIIDKSIKEFEKARKQYTAQFANRAERRSAAKKSADNGKKDDAE